MRTFLPSKPSLALIVLTIYGPVNNGISKSVNITLIDDLYWLKRIRPCSPFIACKISYRSDKLSYPTASRITSGKTR